MRYLNRLGMAVLGLAVALPAMVRADDPGLATTGTIAPTRAARPKAHPNGLFNRCMCTDCQRARIKAKDGVDVPSPPPVPSGIVTGASGRRNGLFSSKDDCQVCQDGGVIVSGPVMMANGTEAPGRAVVGGSAPGYAVTDEPAPIGMVQNSYARKGRTSTGRRAGTTDSSVAQTQFASPTAVPGTEHNRPRIIEHMFGLDAIGKRSAEAMERRHRERHASISYGPKQVEPVVDLPASTVYRIGR